MKLADWIPRTDKKQSKAAWIIVASTVLVAVHKYFGSMTFAESALPAVNSVLYLLLSTFFLFGVLPAGYIKVSDRQSLREFGLQFGDWKAGLGAFFILYPIILIALLSSGSLLDGLRTQYPLDRNAGESLTRFLTYEFLRGVFFYVAWEFFFRGFMLFELRKSMGDWLAICMQVVPSGLWHIGHPFTETITSIVGGVAFGMIALRTRSIVWPLLLHSLTGVALDVVLILR